MNTHSTPPLSIDHNDLLSIRDWVRYYVTEMQHHQVFFGHGCTNALDEAIFMIQSALHLPIGPLEPFWDARLTAAEKSVLHTNLKLRTEQRKPASYIVQQAWLQGECFAIDERAIIPRSFIAELLSDHLMPWVPDPSTPMNILDMCTGSGCLAILAAYAFENAQVDAIDLSEDALALANKNIELHQLSDRVQAIHSDLFNAIPNQQYDIILSNPPYVNEQSMNALPPEYLHEPRMALAGGDTGMDLIDRILQEAPKHLNDGGFLVVELGNERPYFEAAYPDLEVVWLETSAGDDQVFLVQKENLV